METKIHWFLSSQSEWRVEESIAAYGSIRIYYAFKVCFVRVIAGQATLRRMGYASLVFFKPVDSTARNGTSVSVMSTRLP